MMSDPTKLVTVTRCHQVWEAEILRDRLESGGIPAFVQGAEANLSLSYVGTALGGVRVQVSEVDLEAARELIEADAYQRLTAGAWICPRCEEPNDASFDLCYSCSLPRSMAGGDPHDGKSKRQQRGGTATAKPVTVPVETGGTVEPSSNNPYHPPSLERLQADDEAFFQATDGNPLRIDLVRADDALRRAMNLAIIGLVVPFPVFHLLSAYHAVQARRYGAARVKRLRRRLYWVELLDIAVISVTLILLFVLPFVF